MNVVRGSCGRCSERRCSAATTLLKRPADAALSQGIWAVLAVFLLIYIVKSNERFSARQEEREKQYQELLSALTEKFNVLSVIERDITEVKEYIMADTKEVNQIYVAVDCGKSDTKLVSYNVTGNKKIKAKFRTKISPGTFDDDMYGRGTFIAQIDDGPVYKVGRDARTEPSLESTKKTDIHRVCTLAAIAYACGSKGDNDVTIAIGLPLQICNIAEERIEYKDFILGEIGKEHTVKIKPVCNGPVLTVKFRFKAERVYPEGIGVLYEYPTQFSGPTGIIDIGNLNINLLYSDQFLPLNESCSTDELGGQILLTGLAQELTSNFARCDEHMALSILARKELNRCLPDKTGKHPEIVEESRKIIKNNLSEYVGKIKGKCDAKHWPIAYMDLVAMGGTSKLISEELKEAFGDQIFIPEEPEFVNAKGFLRKICADDGIDVKATQTEEG